MQEARVTSSDNLVFFAPSRVPAWIAASFATVLVSARIELISGSVSWPHPPWGIAWWFGALLVLLCAIPRRVEVGAEGLAVSWLSTPRFVRYDDVVRAAALSSNELLIELSNGETLRICNTLREGASRAVLTQLWQTIARAAEDDARAHECDVLARNGRTTTAWAESLAHVAAGSEYRSALDRDRLWELVRHPAIDAELRAAAAVALAPSLDPRGRDEMRQIAGRSVIEPLKGALEIVARTHAPDDLRAALELFPAEPAPSTLHPNEV